MDETKQTVVSGALALLERLAQGDLSGFDDVRNEDSLAVKLRAIAKRWQQERAETATQTMLHIVEENAAFERESQIFAAYADPVMILDARGFVTRANTSFLELVGASDDEVIGQPLDDFVVGAQVVAVKLIPRLRMEGVVRDVLLDLIDRHGRPIPARVSGSVVVRTRTLTEFVVVARDMRDSLGRLAAEAAAAEEQQRAAELGDLLQSLDAANRELASSRERLLHADRLAAVGQIAAGVVHEINNPAAFILTNLSVLRQRLTELGRVCADHTEGESSPDVVSLDRSIAAILDDARVMLDESIQGIDRIRSITRDLRTFSRIEHSEIQFIDVNELLRIACRMIRHQLRTRGKLIQELSPMPAVAADRGKLAQVFINLLVNAVHALDEAKPGENKIFVTSGMVDGRLKVTVRDTGAGIPKALREKIFEPFFTTKPREAGTGLGLSLSAEIVKKHGGQILLESEVGRGSCFEVWLPRDTGLEVEPATERPVRVPERARRARVLVVDDEPALCEAFRRALEPGHDVVTAKGGAAALSVIEQDQRFDVVLCDLMMPDVDGVDVHRALESKAPELLSKLVFCTGGAFTARARDFIASVENRCLEKPIPTKMLRAIIDQTVAARD